MKTNLLDVFIQHSEELKSLHSPVLHNIFFDTDALEKILNKKKCIIIRKENSIFILILRHNIYYEMLYMSTDHESLKNSIYLLLDEYKNKYKLCVSVIGHEKTAGVISDIFKDCGFTLGRKIARMRNLADKRNLQHSIDILCDGEKGEVEFAKKEDAQGIFDLLMTEFDLRSDNIPELSEIEENISHNQVIVIRQNCKIIALHYFTRKNSCVYGWYDVTSREHRKSHLYLYISQFLYNYWKDQNKVMRSYSWRDVANKRLMNLARQSNQVPDGVYIYNMLYDPPNIQGTPQEGAA